MAGRLKIVFMGTPEYAVPCLNALAARGYDVPLVVTQPDKPRGRGRRMAPPPVKTAAQSLDLAVIQPVSVRTEEFACRLADIGPDLLVVVAYGKILPRPVLDLPARGAVNIHPSLLPRYRGPSPIQWAIACMEQETGVTSIFMDEGMDSGDMILSARAPILPDDTAADLHDRLAALGAAVLIDTLDLIENGTAVPVPQDPEKVTFAPLLRKADGRIDWNRPSEGLCRFVNAMNPWPGAFTEADGRRYRILRALPVALEKVPPPGTVVGRFPGELVVATADGGLSIERIQGEAGKPLAVADFLRGHAIAEGTVFS
ncbi:MAG: methionyl-tRNA formyltransferase [Thermodesulfobacteriota bacterium]